MDDVRLLFLWNGLASVSGALIRAFNENDPVNGLIILEFCGSIEAVLRALFNESKRHKALKIGGF